jgi:hypothetical protein
MANPRATPQPVACDQCIEALSGRPQAYSFSLHALLHWGCQAFWQVINFCRFSLIGPH